MGRSMLYSLIDPVVKENMISSVSAVNTNTSTSMKLFIFSVARLQTDQAGLITVRQIVRLSKKNESDL